MPEKKKKKKRRISVRNLSGLFSWNIGTIIFGAIFVYIIISFFLYLTADHITSYTVTAGPLAQNPTFQALVLRSEELVQADADGYIDVYKRQVWERFSLSMKIPERIRFREMTCILSLIHI